MILKLTLDLPEERSYIKIMRLMGRTLLEHLKADEKEIDEVELVVGELCANVVRHAKSSERRYQVALEFYSDHVAIEVCDNGAGFDVAAVAPVGSDRPDEATGYARIGGYGLKLVELLSDRVEFQASDSSGMTVRAEKALHFAATPPDANGGGKPAE